MPFQLLNEDLFARYLTWLVTVGKNGQPMSACANYLTGICMHYNEVHHSAKSALPWNMEKIGTPKLEAPEKRG